MKINDKFCVFQMILKAVKDSFGFRADFMVGFILYSDSLSMANHVHGKPYFFDIMENCKWKVTQYVY